MLRSLKNVPLVGPLALAAYRRIEFQFAKRRIMDRDSLLNFWQQPEPPGNVPADYLREDAFERSQALLEAISFLPKSARILEVGCNAGRNIAHLFRNGYTGVEAVEISPHAVKLLRETFPELAGVLVHNGPAEEILPQFADQSFDLVFTMAVLEHIHPDSAEVFDNIARIAKTIVAVEPSFYNASTRQYPHDLKQIFKSRGFRLTRKQPMGNVKDVETYSLYQFERA